MAELVGMAATRKSLSYLQVTKSMKCMSQRIGVDSFSTQVGHWS